MGEKSRFVPFHWTPGSWGLEGTSFQRAKAEYYYDGEDLERELAKIDYQDKPIEYEKKINDINYHYGHIDGKEYEFQKINIDYQYNQIDETSKQLNELKVEKSFGDISEIEYEKRHYTLNKEPWVKVIDMNFESENATNGYLDLDWNEHFIEFLKQNGYKGPTPEVLVDQWVQDVCRSIVEESEGIQMGDNIATINPQSSTEQTPRNDNKTEYR